MVSSLSNYKEKIKNLRNSAQETQAAIKIRDKLTELRSKDIIISSYRWIWELIQNAKDCPNSSGKIDIEITFDSVQRIVIFKHNGKLFSTKNIIYLIEQVSTKERTRDSANTGKFGTGFLTTNLLSPVVTISGLLQDEDEPNIAQFTVTLDRSGNSIDELKTAIKDSCDQLENNTTNITHPITGNEMNTVFTYMLDDSGVQAAQNGLNNFLITAPYVFAFVEELNKITINNCGTVSVYTRTETCLTNSDNVFVSRILRNEDSKPINILVIKNDLLMLAAEIKQYNRENHIAPYDENLPKLFCDFPLLGTHNFSFPVVLNSRYFDPNEPRNGIILYDKDSLQNKAILESACDLYASMIEYFIESNYKDIYNVAIIPPIESKDWIDQIWYESSIISSLKNMIKLFPMFTTLKTSNQALYDNQNNCTLVLLRDDTKEVRESVWHLSSQLFPNKHIVFEDTENWYHSLWEDCRNYGVLELILEVEELGQLDKLTELVPNAIKWLNQLYSLIYDKCSNRTDVIMRDNKIFPNQSGDFCCLKDLKSDSGIDDAYKEAAQLISINYRSVLLDVRILPRDLVALSFNEAANQMINRAQEFNVHPDQFYKHIIGIQNNPPQYQQLFINLFNVLYPNSPIITCNVSHFSERLLNNALDYWSKKLCANIAKHSCLKEFCSAFDMDSIEEAEKWLSEFIDYLKIVNQLNLLDDFAIIPNQNGCFKTKSYLFCDVESIPEFMKDVCRIAGTDLREDMASNNIINVSNIISHKKGFKDVSEVITNYIREHKNNIRVSSEEKIAFDETYKWLRERKDDQTVKRNFQELLDHLYWFYNDDEISESIIKAKSLDNILSKFGISDVRQLEDMLIQREQPTPIVPNTTIEEMLCQFGISSPEELKRLIANKTIGTEFLHINDASFEKYLFVQELIERALTNIKAHLSTLDEYDLSDSVQLHKTIFTAKKDGNEIYIIARPSDYNEVILYYDAEFDTLDYTKDFELWIENGKSEPQRLTFGRILKLTKVNRIPLGRIQ